MCTQLKFRFFKIDVVEKDGSLIGSLCMRHRISAESLYHNSDASYIYRKLKSHLLEKCGSYFENEDVTFILGETHGQLRHVAIDDEDDLLTVLEALNTWHDARDRTVITLIVVADCENEASVEQAEGLDIRTADSNGWPDDRGSTASAESDSDSDSEASSAWSFIQHLQEAMDDLTAQVSSLSTALAPLSSAINRIETAVKRNATDLSAEVKSTEKTVKSMLPRFYKLMATLEKQYGPTFCGKKKAGQSQKKKNKSAALPLQQEKEDIESLADSNEEKREDLVSELLNARSELDNKFRAATESLPKELRQEIPCPSGASSTSAVASSSSDPNEDLDDIDDASSDSFESSFEVANESDFEEAQSSDRIVRCLNFLLAMDYNYEGGWLSRLVEVKDRNLVSVLNISEKIAFFTDFEVI